MNTKRIPFLSFCLTVSLMVCFLSAGISGESNWTKGKTAGQRKVFKENGVEYAFRWCPPGKFMMGTPPVDFNSSSGFEEQQRNIRESQHWVNLTRGFWIMETEVTQSMWKSVMERSIEDQGNRTEQRELYGNGPDFPIYYVTWKEAAEFCDKLSKLINCRVALPTEAQWEYACRAGSTGPYAGNLDYLAWYGELDSNDSAHKVGQKQPNAWGLYDMHGNVQEWCFDYFSYAYQFPPSTEDPAGPPEGGGRVTRGGSWIERAEDCRSAVRNEFDIAFFNIGFRAVIISPDEPRSDRETGEDNDLLETR